MSTREEYTSDVAAALDATEDLVQTAELTPGLHVIATRSTATSKTIHTERFEQRPERPRGTVKAVTQDGFVRALELVVADRAVVYANPDTCQLVAVVNDDRAGDAGWRDHRIELDLRPTPEWDLWTKHQGLGSQEKFANVIEEGQAEIVDPSSTVMLDLAQTFAATTAAKFRQAGRLQDGRQQFVYEEEIEAKAGESGSLAIPAEFLLGLRPFFGADRYEVLARLRYRLSRGELQIGYQLHRPEDVKRKAFDELVAAVESRTDLPLVHGIPAAPTVPLAGS